MQQMNEGHVVTCVVNECGYYKDGMCRAPSIDVGDMHPTCDTYTTQQVSQAELEMPDIATCKVTDCRFNQSQDCMAPGITVAHHSGHADCLTYRS